jgi:hypothetical protein
LLWRYARPARPPFPPALGKLAGDGAHETNAAVTPKPAISLVLRWSQTVIDLADGDAAKGNFIGPNRMSGSGDQPASFARAITAHAISYRPASCARASGVSDVRPKGQHQRAAGR